jgi:hypothetical protein
VRRYPEQFSRGARTCNYQSTRAVQEGEVALTQIQAFIDDSASDKGDKRFFIAGYVARAEVWDAFSKAWSIELACGTPISYLKMSEAKAFRGEFKGWTMKQRRRKLTKLHRVIESFQLMSFHSSMARDAAFERYKRTAPRGLSSPHFLCGFAAISGVTRYFSDTPESCSIEFVFDTQTGVDEDTDLFFDEMVKRIPKARSVIAAKPRFVDDKASAPLQAADFLAWHLRRSHEDNGSWGSASELDPTGVRHLHCGDLDSAIPAWTEFDEQEPGVKQLQTKANWKALKKVVRAQLEADYLPPHGTRTNNFVFGIRDRARRLLRHWRTK